MINIKRHFKMRYCQRILGMTDDKEIKQYMAMHDDQLTEWALKLWENARFIWKGQLGDNITRHFYLTGDNIILVVDTDNTCLWTLYRIDFGFPEATNRKVIKDLVAAIEGVRTQLETLQTRVEKLQEKNQVKIEKLDAQIRAIDTQIAALQAKRDNILASREILENEVKLMQNEVKPLGAQLDQYATMLCNSVAYKKDILANSAGK